MASKLSIGFIGAGTMATALAKSLSFTHKSSTQKDIIASDPGELAREAFTRTIGAKTTPSNALVVKSSNVVLLAVKPDQVTNVLAEIRGNFTENHLLISIAAGVPLAKLETELQTGSRLVRVMTNTPALVNAAVSLFAVGKSALPADAELTQKLFSAVGVAFPIKEQLLDAVTGLSGSGPAYVFMFIEALSDGGVATGLPRRSHATRLAAQTVMGSAKMVLETGLHAGALKDMVTSPAGTTIEGIHELEKGHFRGTVMSAVRAGTEKSRKLGQA